MTVINTNVKSLVAQASLAANSKNQATAMERLSTGSRINSAKDDAAGLAIGSRMTSQVRGLSMAIRNANDGISLAQTAEGALDETTSMLQRMRELSLQAANTVNSASDRAALDAEVQQLKTEIDRIATTTTFNGQKILDGSFSGDLQIGDKAGQTMQLAVASMATTAMGETASGLAQTSTKAALVVTGASTNVADYQGATFTATVNGTQKTITLPVASQAQVVVAGAKIESAAVGANRAQDISSHGQIGGFDQQTTNLSTATNAKLMISVRGGVNQEIDISNSTYYVAAARATGTEVVNALQTELDAHAAFQGANKLTVSLTDAGRVKFDFANGDRAAIALTDVTGAQALASTLGALVGNATESSTTGSIVLGTTAAGTWKDVSGNTSFDVVNTATGVRSHFDLTAQITAKGYDAAKLTVDQFIEVYNATAVDSSGNQVSAYSKSTNLGALVLSGPGGYGPVALVNSPFSNGALLAGMPPATSWIDTAAGDNLGPVIMTVGAAHDGISIKIGDNTKVDMLLTNATYQTKTQLAAEIQAQINASGAFTGDNAITVTGTLDANLREGFTFANAAGKAIEVTGEFVNALVGTSAGVASTLGVSTSPSGSSQWDAVTSVAKVGGVDFPDSVGNKFTQITHTYAAAAANRTFTLNANNNGNVALDITAAIAARSTSTTYRTAALTGAELVTVLNDTITASGAFTGNNAVTASINSNGQLAFSVAGSAGAGINPSLVVGGTATTGLVALTSAFNDGTSVNSVTSGADGVAVITSTGDKEKFGTTDYVISGARFGNNRLSLAIGSGSPINLTIADGTYSSAESLAAEINTKIQASGLFTGANAVTASAVTNPTTGAETLAFNAGNAGSSVTFKGGLALDLVGTITQTATGQSAGFIAVGNTLLDAGTDSLEFKYNGVAYTTAAFPVAAVTTTSMDAALAAATDANGNALGAGKLVSSNLAAGTLTISIDQGATNTASRNDSFTDLTYIDGGGLGNVEAKTISTTVGALAVGDVFKFNFQGVNYTSAALATADTAGANTAFDTAVDSDGNILGINKITWADATTVGADNIGEFVTSIRKFSAANYAVANTPVIMPGTRAATGGVDLSVDNNVTLSATDASGGVVSNTFALGSSDGAVSFADYASLLETAANTAFAGTGNTFTAAYADNKISFQSNQNNVSNVALSGVSVTDAFGQGVSGTNPTAASAVGQFFTMADVAAAVNEDLGADAEATFDTSNNSWKFEVTAGNAGVASTVALSGSGLTALQIAGNLTATGSAGEASASRLSMITVDTVANANAATSSIDNAIEYVNSQRASLGAIQNRLDHTVSNLTNIATNTEAARSRIMDADYGQESAALAKAQIIQQAATAMLAQANQSSQSVLSLLQ